MTWDRDKFSYVTCTHLFPVSPLLPWMTADLVTQFSILPLVGGVSGVYWALEDTGRCVTFIEIIAWVSNRLVHAVGI